MDNLETNTAMMRELKTLFTEREIPFDANESRIFCFPHIINIVVQHVLDKFRASSSSDLDTGSNPSESHALHQARKIIVTIRLSGQRRDQWIKWIETGMTNKQSIC
jgi:hypothetical protein